MGAIADRIQKATTAWSEDLHPRMAKGPGGGRFKKKDEDQRRSTWRKVKGKWTRRPTAEEQEELARAFYERLWPTVAAYYGATGQPPPNFSFAALPPGDDAWVTFDANGMRQVQISPKLIRMMTSRRKFQRNTARLDLLHEWRHIFQNSELYFIGRDLPHNDQPIERDALAFSSQIERSLERWERRNRRRRRRGKRRLPSPVAQLLNPDPTSENAGADPTAIRYPGF